MSGERKVEVFGAGCPLCEAAARVVRGLACPACDVRVLDLRTPAGAARAAEVGVRTVPAVAVDGWLADCCAGGLDEAGLRAAGVGRPL